MISLSWSVIKIAGILLLVTGWLLSKLKKKVYKHTGLLGQVWAWSFIVLVILILAPMFITFPDVSYSSLYSYPVQDVVGNSRPILSLADDESGLRGSFILGVSSGESEYTFYVDGGQSGITRETIRAKGTRIFLHADNTQLFEKHYFLYQCREQYYLLIFRCYDERTFSHYELHLPEGVIMREVLLDNQ